MLDEQKSIGFKKCYIHAIKMDKSKGIFLSLNKNFYKFSFLCAIQIKRFHIKKMFKAEFRFTQVSF